MTSVIPINFYTYLALAIQSFYGAVAVQEFAADNLLQLFFYIVIVALMMGVILFLSHILGSRHKERTTGEVYESGIKATGDARTLFSARFYLVAILFVIFDLEGLFLFAWASSVRELGLNGYVTILIFSVTLFAALFYFIRTKALDFGPRLRKPGDNLPVPYAVVAKGDSHGL